MENRAAVTKVAKMLSILLQRYEPEIVITFFIFLIKKKEYKFRKNTT